MIKDISTSYKKIESKKRIKAAAFKVAGFVSFNDYDYAAEQKERLVQTGTAEQRVLTKAELYIDPSSDSADSCIRLCYRCGKRFVHKPWHYPLASFILCNSCCKEEEEKRDKKSREADLKEIAKWRSFKENDRTSQILDLFNRNY